MFKEFDNVKIEIYIFGNDSFTGVRKMFYYSYSSKDIVFGKFNCDKSKMNIIR